MEVANRAAILARAMRQKNQLELSLGSGTRGEAPRTGSQATEARAAEACLDVAGPSAVKRAQAYIASGHTIVVDIDLEKFFDRVNHDILIGLVAKRVADKHILKLIRGFLTAGVLEGGLVSPTDVDVLDRELEKRDHRFVRYADDCNIYVRSQRAGERVTAVIEKFLAKRLKLKGNKAKSAVAKPGVRKFLGFG